MVISKLYQIHFANNGLSCDEFGIYEESETTQDIYHVDDCNQLRKSLGLYIETDDIDLFGAFSEGSSEGYYKIEEGTITGIERIVCRI